MPADRRPNIILVLTDDQGYADLGCNGNPWLKTPNIDAFHNEAARLTDFHVEPLCTPTRGALMTGHRPIRNGAWATNWGRSILRREEVTLPQYLADRGYATGLFGKWHLGDNFPFRPQDRGFGKVVAHKGGGVGQTSDFWGNNYFDDTYFHNGEPVGHEGYCTDVWFDEAMHFIREKREQPFLVCIHTNAPHHPYLVDRSFSEPYTGNSEIPEPDFFGMIANIDENFGRLWRMLRALNLEENTILIFMTDNGSSGGCLTGGGEFVTGGFNAGMRGKKASYYDGGHRVPFFIRWPAGGIGGGREISELGLGIDLFPTLVDLAGLPPPDVEFDGTSLRPILKGEVEALPEDRIHFIQIRQSENPPEKWTNAVMTRRWRLIHGRELYDIIADPGQKEDVAVAHPDVVAKLRAAHESWWAEVSPAMAEASRIILGHEAENPTCLTTMDVHGDVAWSQAHLVRAVRSAGNWEVSFEAPGRYRFELRRWPEELRVPTDGLPPESEVARIAPYMPIGEAMPWVPVSARIGCFGDESRAAYEPGSEGVTFEIDIRQSGPTRFDAWFADAEGEEWGAYFVTVERLGSIR